jgi:serine/threonine protein kinase
MAQSNDDREFSELLLEWGLITRQELEDASRLHETATRNGSTAPAFTETLIKYGFLTPRQVSEAKSADTKGVFYCTACSVGFEVRISSSRRNYQCPRCQGPLQREAGQLPPKATTALLTDHVPVDVQVALHNADSRFGKYVLLAEVGRGGAAVIRKAWDSEEKTYVALKFLRPQEGADPEKVEALIREGERAVYLRHPNLIRVYELGYISRQYYIAMEYLEGYTLAELIRSALLKSKVSPFYDDPTRYLMMLRDVARAVHYAHSRTPPLVHCDLKPANVFIELSWRPYVLDFGVARELNPGAKDVDAGLVKGSPAYMAPEQVLGRPDEIDARTDVYGLGAILYDLLAGRPPLTGDLQEVLDKNLLMVGVPSPSDVLKTRGEISGGGTARNYRVPPEIEAICMKCLAKEKKDRFATAKDVADALTQATRARPLTQVHKPETTRRIVSQTPPALPVVTPTPMAPVEARGAAARAKGASRWPAAIATVAAATVAVVAIWRFTTRPAAP